jgi:N-acyl-D-aspartate/D-glutamate deacylase
LIEKLFVGALVADGTGESLKKFNVGTSQGEIVWVGEDDVPATQKIDVSQKVLAPGFIDIHTHSDLTLLSNPLAQSKIRQGITTEVIGNCGFGVAPYPEGEDGELLKAAVAYLQVDPSTEWRWSDLREFLNVLEQSGTSLNVASLIGHIPIHASVVGFGKDPATKNQITEMQELLRENMRQGAFGLSTGLNYSPVSYASRDELVGLAQVVKEFDGIFACHMREYGDDLMKSVEELMSITRATGVRTQISHLVTVGERNWGNVERALAIVESMNQEGFEVDVDVYPYIAGNCPLSQLLPDWAQEGGDSRMRLRMSETPAREKIQQHWKKAEVIWSNIQIANVAKGREEFVGKTVTSIAEEQGRSPALVALDLLADMGNSLGIIAFGRSENDVRAVFAHKRAIVGSDGQSLDPDGPTGVGSPHPRSYGCYPRLLHEYTGANGISLERAVHISTLAAARKLRIKDRGQIATGFKADLVVFDPRNVKDQATYVDPQKFPIGIEHVLVNGEFAIKDGKHTGKKPGQIIRT